MTGRQFSHWPSRASIRFFGFDPTEVTQFLRAVQSGRPEADVFEEMTVVRDTRIQKETERAARVAAKKADHDRNIPRA